MLGLAWLVWTGGDVWGIAALAVLSAVMSTVFWPALWALIPNLVEDERDYGVANSAWATLDNIAWVVGPAIAGVILVTADQAWPFLINAVTFGLMAAILATIPSRVRTAVGAGGHAGDTQAADPSNRSAARRVNRRAMAGILLLGVLAAFAGAGINILTVVLVVDVFHANDDATGYLNSAVGLGGTIGAVLAGFLVLRPRLGPVILIAAASVGLSVVALGYAPTVAVAFVAIAGAAIAFLVLEVVRTTILQRLVPDSFRGRFTGILLTAVMLSEIAGTIVLPVLVATVGVSLSLTAVGILAVLGGILAVGLIGTAGGPAGPTAEVSELPPRVDPLHA
jgi:ENTS family enterobactin (siderophore) exporter